MADTREQLRTVAQRTGLWLYCQAGVVFGLVGQLVLHAVGSQKDPVGKVLTGVGGALIVVCLAVVCILMGWQLRRAANQDGRANPA